MSARIQPWRCGSICVANTNRWRIGPETSYTSTDRQRDIETQTDRQTDRLIRNVGHVLRWRHHQLRWISIKSQFAAACFCFTYLSRLQQHSARRQQLQQRLRRQVISCTFLIRRRRWSRWIIHFWPDRWAVSLSLKIGPLSWLSSVRRPSSVCLSVCHGCILAKRCEMVTINH